MIAPPITIPSYVDFCDVVDMPYIGFTLPLLLLTLPVAIFSVSFIEVRKYIKKMMMLMNFKEIQSTLKIKEEVNLFSIFY